MGKDFYEQKKKSLLKRKEASSFHFEERIRRIESGGINKYPPAKLTLWLFREKGFSVSDEEIDSIAQRCDYNPDTLRDRYRGWVIQYNEDLNNPDTRWSHRWDRCWWHQLKVLEDIYVDKAPNGTTKESDTINWEQRKWELATGLLIHYPELTFVSAIQMAEGFIKYYKNPDAIGFIKKHMLDTENEEN